MLYLQVMHTLFFQDLSSQNMYDSGMALTGLSCFVTQDLARDLANDIMTLVGIHGNHMTVVFCHPRFS